MLKLTRGDRTKPSIAQCDRVAVVGKGYLSKAAAGEDGERMRDAVTVAFCRLYVGADFGDRAARSFFTPQGLAALSAQHERRVENDTHGLMVYESDPPPMFAHQKYEMNITTQQQRLVDAIAAAVAQAPHLTERQRLSFDLYSASFFEPTADARLLMQMMAVEVLLELSPRSAAAQAHVAQLIKITDANSALAKVDKESMRSSLKWLYDESIGQGGRKLARRLGTQTYLKKNPEQFFTKCYTLRSRLVHAGGTRPTREEVGAAAAEFEHFVGDLLAVVATEPAPPSGAEQPPKPTSGLAAARAWLGVQLVRAGYWLVDS